MTEVQFARRLVSSESLGLMEVPADRVHRLKPGQAVVLQAYKPGQRIRALDEAYVVGSPEAEPPASH